jgi:hypothetical protein
MNQNFAAMILGGTGQVGGAAVAELLAIPECREVVMVSRKPPRDPHPLHADGVVVKPLSDASLLQPCVTLRRERF